MIDSSLRSIRQAIRSLGRSPGYAATCVLTLALGIGATVTIFAVVDAVLLRPLPYPSPDDLVRVTSEARGGLSTMSPPDFEDMRAGGHSIRSMAAYHYTHLTLSGTGDPERITAARATPGLMATLGVAPAVGRDFGEQDAVDGGAHVVLLSDALWQRRFGADPGVVGRDIRVNGEPYVVAGVMPPGFAFPAEAQAWVPLGFTEDDLTTQRGAHYLTVVGRLAPGATAASAERDLDVIAARLAADFPDTNAQEGAAVRPLQVALVGDVTTRLWILFAAVALLLLIASANVASLTLARALDRGRDVAVRAALGAGRARVVWERIMETVVLALGAGLLGALLAVWALQALVVAEADRIPRLAAAAIDLRVLGFAVGVSLLTGLVAGAYPAFRLTRLQGLSERLAEGGRGRTETRGGARMRSLLVAGETALALVLLVGAGLLGRSLAKLGAVEPGFRTEGVLTFDLSLPESRYTDPARVQAFYDGLIERVAAIPGVQDAGAVAGLPLTDYYYSISVERLDGGPAYDEPVNAKSVQVRVATPGYFRALGLRLRAGRFLDGTDRDGAPNAVVVNESAAKLLWPGESAVGHSMELGTSLGLGRGRVGGTVVGVVGDAREYGPAEVPRPEVFAAHAQFPVEDMTLTVHTAGNPSSLLPAIRARVRQLDPELPLSDVATVDQLVRESLGQSRFYSLMLGLFAGLAVLLSAIGIYGITAYAVSRRTREVGIRMALGAGPAAVRRLLLGGGLMLAGLGITAGLAVSVLLSRFLAGLLYAMSPTDPVTLLGTATLLSAVAWLASWIPARRAARVDPAIALREE